jgi:Rho termination factor, N-terminal domain
VPRRVPQAAAGYPAGMATDHGSQIKNDEQYEALRDKGMSKNKAARIANANAGSSGGNAASKRGGKSSKYEDKTKDELMQQAKNVGISGRSKMNKGELIDALRNH